MARVAIITDTHFGCRSEGPAFFNSATRFLRETFFPEIDKRGIKTVVHLGDLVDRRKYIAFVTANVMRREFVDPLLDRDIELIITPGNHDLPYRNLVSVNAEREILPPHARVRVVDKPQVWMMYDTPVLLLPWICDENREASLDMIKKRDARVAMGHLELAGFEMYRGSVQEKGMNPSLFDGYDMVLSGHYHHPSSKGCVTYLGAPWQMTWSDYDCPRGFSVLDTDTLEIEFVPNPRPIFKKVRYTDGALLGDEDLSECVVKLIVSGGKSDTVKYDRAVSAVESVAASIQVVDDHKHADVVDTDVETSDTLALLFKSIEDSSIDCDKAALSALLADLYDKAMEAE